MKIVKTILAFSLLTFISMSVSGQTVFQADRESYQLNNYKYEFIIFSDSTCFIQRYYLDDFSKYSLYKGNLEKINDTLYEFSYQPVVEFGCNKRLHWSQDSVRFCIRQTDTTIVPKTIDVTVGNGSQRMIELKDTLTTVFLKGAGQNKFTLDTEFIDPLTKKKVVMTIEPHSEPYLTYYGVEADKLKLKISIMNNVLTVYPDRKHIWDKETFVKVK